MDGWIDGEIYAAFRTCTPATIARIQCSRGHIHPSTTDVRQTVSTTLPTALVRAGMAADDQLVAAGIHGAAGGDD